MDTQEMMKFLQSLPPVVAVVAWEVLHGRMDLEVIKLADETDEEYEKYDLIRCVANGNPSHPPLQEAEWLINELKECVK